MANLDHVLDVIEQSKDDEGLTGEPTAAALELVRELAPELVDVEASRAAYALDLAEGQVELHHGESIEWTGTVPSFLEQNDHLDEAEVLLVRSMKPGNTVLMGGGAAPEFQLRRVA